MARPQSPDYDQRRQLILDQAAGLFATQGFHSASVASIADACGTSKALIYHYFSSKEEILFGAMADHVGLLLETATEAMAGDLPPADKLRDVTRKFLGIYRSSRPRHVVLMNELKSLEPSQRKQIVGLERDVIAVFEALIGDIGGAAMDDAHTRTVATRLFMGMINWTYTWFEEGGAMTSDQVADMAAETFITGLEKGEFSALTAKSSRVRALA